MKIISKYSMLGMLLFVSFISFSQTGSNQILERTTINPFNLQSKDLVGTSYINDDFLSAKLIDGEEMYSMRYDAYKDVFEVKRAGEIFYYLPKKFDYPVTFIDSKKVYQVFLHEKKNKTTSGFFVVLNKGKNGVLLLKEKINFQKETSIIYDVKNYLCKKIVDKTL